MSAGKTLVVRVDATSSIGSGHALRCLAIAQAAETSGWKVRFAVSCEETASLLASRERYADILGGDPEGFGSIEAEQLNAYCLAVGATVLFIDSYAVTKGFFDGLQNLRDAGVRIGYLDDLYTFEEGITVAPVRRDVDLVLNYSFYADEEAYANVYAGSEADLLLGPSYAPLRREFWETCEHACSDEVRNVLVTTGATNPSRFLERFAMLARETFPAATVHVIVGSSSSFDGPKDGLDLMGAQDSLLPLMRECDLCITAAGTTLYELSATGVPTLAVAIIDNQIENAMALARLDLGFGHLAEDSDEKLFADLSTLRDVEVRSRFSKRMQETVRGDGAMKIAQRLQQQPS